MCGGGGGAMSREAFEAWCERTCHFSSANNDWARIAWSARDAEVEALKARVEEHEKVCAGEWISLLRSDVAPPEPLQVVTTFRAPNTITFGNWIDSRGCWLSQADYWLEEKMPGEQR